MTSASHICFPMLIMWLPLESWQADDRFRGLQSQCSTWPSYKIDILILRDELPHHPPKMIQTQYSFGLAFQRAVPLVPLQLVIVASIIFLVFSITQYIRRSKKQLPLPPGPRPLPIVGNLFDIPKVFSSPKYRDLSDKYGSFQADCNILWPSDNNYLVSHSQVI